MKVYAFIKVQENPRGDIGTTSGDVIYFYPIQDDIGKNTLDNDDGAAFFFPVVVDITIPCGSNFDNHIHDCTRCVNCDPDECDVIKYSRAIWSAGDIDNPPKPIKARRYKVNIDTILDATKKTLVQKVGKSIADKDSIVNNAKNDEKSKTIFIDKAVAK